jgi:hypothetical protein
MICPCCRSVFHRRQHVRTWSQASLSAYLEQRGFRILDAFTTDFSKVETAEERWERLRWWKRAIKTMKGQTPKASDSAKNPNLVVMFQPAS